MIWDLSPLTALSGLSELYISNTLVEDLTPLTALPGLTKLSVRDTMIEDLTPLAKLTRLSGLSLDNTMINDLIPLTALTSLVALYFDNTEVTDLTPLVGLTGLRRLSLIHTPVIDLRPLSHLRKLADEPAPMGLDFSDTAATDVDPRIAEIANMEDPASRARELFAYLETWVPPGEVGVHSVVEREPLLPVSRPAPVQPIVSDSRISLAASPEVLPSTNAVARAEEGWLALAEFRASFGSSFHIENYAPLPAILKDFDRAMGADYASCRPIAIGMHGQRIIAQSRDKGLLETLPMGAEPELKAFAAAIATFVERFPDWQEYNADTPPEADAGLTDEDRSAFAGVDDAVAQTPQADAAYKEEFHVTVKVGSDQKATGVEVHGLDSSTRELALGLAQDVLSKIKSGEIARKQTEEMARVGATELAKIKWYAGGFTLDALHRASPSLRKLAKQRPKSFGWLTAVLDYFGTP